MVNKLKITVETHCKIQGFDCIFREWKTERTTRYNIVYDNSRVLPYPTKYEIVVLENKSVIASSAISYDVEEDEIVWDNGVFNSVKTYKTDKLEDFDHDFTKYLLGAPRNV